MQDFDTMWDQALLSASEIPKENIEEGLYKLKIRDSVQLQSALATCMNNKLIETEQCKAIKDTRPW